MAAVTVCCPTCWTWSELKSSTTCKRCSTPLILPDGRRVDEMANAPAEAWAAPPGYAFNTHMATLGPPRPQGFNWVALARWITIGNGALTVLGLIALGLIVEYVNIPVQNPATGQIVLQTVNIRPALLAIAVVVALASGLFAWLTGFTLARVIFLMLILLGVTASLTRLSGEPSAVVVGSLVEVVLDLGFAFVLVMSLLAPQRTPGR